MAKKFKYESSIADYEEALSSLNVPYLSKLSAPVLGVLRKVRPSTTLLALRLLYLAVAEHKVRRFASSRLLFCVALAIALPSTQEMNRRLSRMARSSNARLLSELGMPPAFLTGLLNLIRNINPDELKEGTTLVNTPIGPVSIVKIKGVNLCMGDPRLN